MNDVKQEKQTLVIGVTSGIAIYKTLDVISKLRNDYNIRVIMTENAKKMVSPITFSTMSMNRVYYDTFAEKDWITHISVSDEADIFAIIPATANCIGKIANGIGDDLLSTVSISMHCRKIIAPAMNVYMWKNPIVQRNLNVLREEGWEVIEPASGMLACGYEGKGKLASVEDILDVIRGNQILKGKKIVISAGGTIEDIDPVRYISNRSSGKMGMRFAEVARDMGADVCVVHGNIKAEVPSGVKGIGVRSAVDMLDALRETIKDADILVMSAAVADYRVEKIHDEKIKKNSESLEIKLVKNPDILKSLKDDKGNCLFIAFALESENLLKNAEAKLKSKGAELLVANSTKEKISPFGEDSSKVYLLHKEGEVEEFPIMTKREIAKEVLAKAANLL